MNNTPATDFPSLDAPEALVDAFIYFRGWPTVNNTIRDTYGVSAARAAELVDAVHDISNPMAAADAVHALRHANS